MCQRSGIGGVHECGWATCPPDALVHPLLQLAILEVVPVATRAHRFSTRSYTNLSLCSSHMSQKLTTIVHLGSSTQCQITLHA